MLSGLTLDGIKVYIERNNDSVTVEMKNFMAKPDETNENLKKSHFFLFGGIPMEEEKRVPLDRVIFAMQNRIAFKVGSGSHQCYLEGMPLNSGGYRFRSRFEHSNTTYGKKDMNVAEYIQVLAYLMESAAEMNSRRTVKEYQDLPWRMERVFEDIETVKYYIKDNNSPEAINIRFYLEQAEKTLKKADDYTKIMAKLQEIK